MSIVRVLLSGIAAIAAGLPVVSRAEPQDVILPFSCDVFTPTASAESLSARFGAANVKTAPVPWGGAEGGYDEGTVLFDDVPDARLEIYWRDSANKRGPEWVSVRGKKTRWRSPAGITIGTALEHVERLNGKPFRLLGFGSDVSGTVMSWSGGRLESESTAQCRIRMRVGPDWDRLDARGRALTNQLIGEREFSSGHPAMQALNPAVYELLLQYMTAR